MKKAIIGRKLGMTQIFDENGAVIPVTVVEAGPCVVAQVKTVEKEGYDAVQLGFGEVKDKHINKPEKGHFAKSKLAAKKHLREFRVDSADVKVGDEVKADVVRRIFRLYLDGLSVCAICKLFNEEEVLNRHWATTTVDKILSNQLYIGNMVHGKRGKGEIQIFENVVPFIIDKTTFEMVPTVLHLGH